MFKMFVRFETARAIRFCFVARLKREQKINETSRRIVVELIEPDRAPSGKICLWCSGGTEGFNAFCSITKQPKYNKKKS